MANRVAEVERALATVATLGAVLIGAAAAVARWTRDGKQVVYLLATRGELLEAEAGSYRGRTGKAVRYWDSAIS